MAAIAATKTILRIVVPPLVPLPAAKFTMIRIVPTAANRTTEIADQSWKLTRVRGVLEELLSRAACWTRNQERSMSRGFPSMTALLGLLAIAGYQNRDKIAEMLGGLNKPGSSGQGGIGGLLGQLSSSLGGASTGGILSTGLGELLDRFKQSGQGDTAESWVKTGPNKPCTAAQLEKAIGPEVLETLTKQTGFSREELVSRLCRELPDAVDKYTPEGRIPSEAELARS